MSPDVQIKDEGPFALVVGDTEAGEEFVDSWGLGVLSVEDLGRVTVTSEVTGQLAAAAQERGLRVEEG